MFHNIFRVLNFFGCIPRPCSRITRILNIQKTCLEPFHVQFLVKLEHQSCLFYCCLLKVCLSLCSQVKILNIFLNFVSPTSLHIHSFKSIICTYQISIMNHVHPILVVTLYIQAHLCDSETPKTPKQILIGQREQFINPEYRFTYGPFISTNGMSTLKRHLCYDILING